MLRKGFVPWSLADASLADAGGSLRRSFGGIIAMVEREWFDVELDDAGNRARVRVRFRCVPFHFILLPGRRVLAIAVAAL